MNVKIKNMEKSNNPSNQKSSDLKRLRELAHKIEQNKKKNDFNEFGSYHY